jgi:glyoxylase I family protein
VARVLHHAALCTRDVERALSFYRDGLGLEPIMDQEFGGDWPTLFDARGDRLRSVFLGDPARADAGIVELVAFPDGIDDAPAAGAGPREGFFLLSFFVDDVEETIQRLQGLGFADAPRRIEVPGPSAPVQMATVRDPDGVLVELIGGAT